jgi:hypothetical protein
MVESTHPQDPSATPPVAAHRKSASKKASPRTSVAPHQPGGTKSATARAVSGRAAAHKVEEADHIKLKMPLLGSIRLPEPQRLAYYTTIGALGVLGVLEWPVALVLAGGHALASDQHNRAVQQFGEALEDA